MHSWSPLTGLSRGTMKPIRLALAMGLIAFGAASAPTTAVAAAHAPLQGYMFLKLYSDSTLVRLEFNVVDLVRALSLPWDPKAQPTREQVQTSLSAIRQYVDPRFALGAGADSASPIYRSFDFRRTESGEFLLLDYIVRKPLGAKVPITLTPFFE